MIEAALVEEILKRSDIVDVISSYINVIKKGRNYVAICPFHDDKNPSMMISKDKQIFKCFVCGTGGNAITFIQKFEKISFENAVRKLAEFIGFNDERLSVSQKDIQVDEEKERLFLTLSDLTKFYNMALYAKEGEQGLKYLKDRNMTDDVIRQFEIGYCPANPWISIQFLQAKNHSLKDIETVGVAGHSNGQYVDRNAGRVVFPLHNENGRVIGYSARRIIESDDAKYVNSPETPLFQKNRVIYNYHNAKKYSRLDKYCYVLEGFMDVIALYKAGIRSAVALMGTALTSSQVTLLKRLNVEIRLCLDADNPGQMATLKAIEMFDKEGVNYRIVRRFKDVKDSDEALNKYGVDGLRQMVNVLIDKIQFALNYFTSSNPLSTIDQRKKFISDFLPFLKNVNGELELEDYIVNIAKLTNFDRKVVAELVAKYRSKNADFSDKTPIIDIHPERQALQRLRLAERAIVYQMMNYSDAIEFYNQNDVPISDDIFLKIANYVLDYYHEHHQITANDLITKIVLSDDSEDEKNKLISEITDINLDRHYPTYSKKLLEEYLDTIQEERNKEYEKFVFENSLKGKTEQEKLQILLERNRKKNERLNKKEN